ncbi:MAG: hypothetical protein WAU06_00245, partial [Candidatus Nanopelagicales bacterium]
SPTLRLIKSRHIPQMDLGLVLLRMVNLGRLATRIHHPAVNEEWIPAVCRVRESKSARGGI